MKRLRDILAAKLRVGRKRKAWTQEELAAQAGVSARYVGAIERRQVSPSIDVLERLAKALATAPADLLS